MTAWLLALAVAHAHAPQAARVEVDLDEDGAGVLRWRVPWTGPASGLDPTLPEGCVGEPPTVRRDVEALEATRPFRCPTPPRSVALGGVREGGQVVAEVRRAGAARRRLLGAGEALALDVAPPVAPPRSVDPRVVGAALLVAATLGLRAQRLRLAVHAVGVAGVFLLLRSCAFIGGS